MEESTAQNFFTEIFVWGLNIDKQCATGQQEEYIHFPVKLTVGLVVRSVACGQSHTILSTNEGLLYGVGSNSNGQLGIGPTNQQQFIVPQLITKLTNIDSVTSGANHSLALTGTATEYNVIDEGTVYGWGENQYGQLGDTTEICFEPFPLLVESKFQAVLANGAFSVLVQDNDQVLVCGQNVLSIPGEKKLLFQAIEVGDVQLNYICTGHNSILISSVTNLYLAHAQLVELPLQNIQQLYSGINPMVLGEDDILYEFLNDSHALKPIKLPEGTKVLDCTRGQELALVVDDTNTVYEADENVYQVIDQLTNQEVRMVVAGFAHYIALGQITKQNRGSKLILSPKQKPADSESSPKLQPIQTSNNSSIVSPDNMLFSFSLRKDILTHHWSKKKSAPNTQQNILISQSDRKFNLSQALQDDKYTQTEVPDMVRQLQGQIKQLEAEIFTLREEKSQYNQIQTENIQLKKQRDSQKKNLEIQLQYQQTLQEQIQRLIKENESLKLNNFVPVSTKPERKQILEQLNQKEAKLRTMISSFYNEHYRIMANLRAHQS